MHIQGNGGHAAVVREVIVAIGGDWQEKFCFIAVGDNAARKREDSKLRSPSPTLIHPSAVVSESALVGEGTVIMAGAVVQANAVIGRHCIVNTCASVDHDCFVGDYAHIAPGAHLCGGVKVGEGALVGVGVGVPPCTEIPSWCIVKARKLEICFPKEKEKNGLKPA